MLNEMSPKYMQIYDYYVEQIDAGIFQENQKLPSATEMVKQFAVSKIVVINALKKLSGEGYIYSIARKGFYVTGKMNGAAKAYANARPERKRVVIIVPEAREPFATGLLHEVFERLYTNHFYCSIQYTNNIVERESDFLHYALETKADGIILFPCNEDTYSQQLWTAVNKNIPVVLIDRELRGLGLSCITTDNLKAMKSVTRHLLELNHKKIGVFATAAMSILPISERVNGFYAEMNAHNILVQPSHIIVKKSTDAQDNLIDKLNNVIKNKLVTALICLNLYDFELVAKSIQEHGFSCPDDFSVAHFESVSRDSIFVNQTTHIRHNTAEIASKTVETLIESIKQQKNLNKKITVAPSFIEGFTTKKLNDGSL